MGIPFFRRLFRHAPAPALDTTETKASHGDAEAQFHRGQECASGAGEAQDYTEAAEWYQKAAAQDHASAQFNLGVLYAQGRGVSKDEAQAVRWIQKAAQHGDAEAQFNLGMRLYRAVIQARLQAIPESRIAAYQWLQLAAAQGQPEAETFCHRVLLAMTRDEVAEGNRRLAALAEELPPPVPSLT